jgi:hypothetical protein
MLKFGEFLAEGGYHVPVVSLSKDRVDLEKEETRNEINRNFAAELSQQFMNPYGGWKKISRVLEMYGVFLPKVMFSDEVDGEEVVAISQFGNKFGADLDGTVSSFGNPDDSEYYLYYSYGIGADGFYECYAVIVDEEELNDILESDSDIDDVDFDDEYGELDPRQE